MTNKLIWKIRNALKVALQESALAFFLVTFGAAALAISGLIISGAFQVTLVAGYFSVMALVMYFAVFGSMGSGNGVVKILNDPLSEHMAQKIVINWLLICMPLSIFVAYLFLFLSADSFIMEFQLPFLIALAMTGYAMMLISAAIFRAHRMTLYSLLPIHVIKHLVFVLLVIFYQQEINELSDLLRLELLSISFSILVYACFLRVSNILKDCEVVEPEIGKVGVATGVKQSISSATQQVFGLLDVLIVGLVAPPNVTALYALATRVAKVVILGNKAINELSAGRIARYYFREEMDSLQNEVRSACRKAMVLAAPVVVIVALAGVRIEIELGEEYAGFAFVLGIFCLGQFLNALTGPVGIAMNMMSHEIENIQINIICSFLLIVLIILIWKLGDVSAAQLAVVFSISLVLLNVLKSIFLYQKHGLIVLPIKVR